MTIPYWGGKLRRKLAAKVCRFENRQWHANVRILKFILEANRNSLAKETARESSTVPGSQLSNCGTIKTYTWHKSRERQGKAPLVSKLANIIAVQTTRDLPSGSSERDKRNQRGCSTHNYTLL